MALRVLICATCAQPGAEPQGISLAEVLRDRLPPEFRVETCPCMVQCGSPVAVALRGEDRYAYVFAGVDPAAERRQRCTRRPRGAAQPVAIRHSQKKPDIVETGHDFQFRNSCCGYRRYLGPIPSCTVGSLVRYFKTEMETAPCRPSCFLHAPFPPTAARRRKPRSSARASTVPAAGTANARFTAGRSGWACAARGVPRRWTAARRRITQVRFPVRG